MIVAEIRNNQTLRQFNRSQFSLQTMMCIVFVLAFTCVLINLLLSRGTYSSFTTGGDRKEGYSWCVLRSENRVKAVLVDFDNRKEEMPPFFRVTVAGNQRVLVGGIPLLPSDVTQLYVRVNGGEVTSRPMSKNEVECAFTDGGYLRSPMDFCKSVVHQ
jgi:hypothetical protein